MGKLQNQCMHSYVRPNDFWIIGDVTGEYADIYLTGIGKTKLHIIGNRLLIQNDDNVFISQNGHHIIENEVQLEQGDAIEVATYSISLFEGWIEIEGLQEDDKVSLLEVAGEAEKFDGFPHYKRSPRVIYRTEKEKIVIKAPPQKKAMTKGGIAQLLVPTLSTLAFTVLMGFVMQRGPYVYMSIGMTLITLIFSVKNFITQQKEIKESNQKREKVYQKYLLRIRKEIREKRANEKKALTYLFPHLDVISQMVESYSPRLYERNRTDDDFLQVTLGRYAGQSDIQVSYEKDELDVEDDELKEQAKEIQKEYARVDDLPLPINLRQSHLGLVGEKSNIHEQIKSILLQLTFFQSYHDLQIIFVHHESYKEGFYYTRWYPHLHIDAINVTGEICTERARDQIFGSVQQILKERKVKEEEEQKEVIFSPYILFIIDEPNLILNHTIMEYLQQKEMGLDFSVIFTTNLQENLPENAKTVCLIENSQEGRLLLNAGERVDRRFQISHVDDIPLERNARILTPIIHDQGMRSQIPEAITFFEMFKIEHPEELQVAERWKKNESHKTLAVPLGVRAKDDYVELNLHEKAHGPHGLVAGTTGSGKSEIVQSYILSLAANFHPYEVGFLLIDYKGGGMANLFSKLPHLLGTITNLDKAESMRAMTSIKAELARRQQIFSDNGVNHINGYNQLFKLDKVAEPLPHLFLISDEFAELKKEQPEFMSELVSAARIGRSLGIHLILATQKPSGVVDDQIWTNSKFKLCLKVQNAGDSKEMLRTPDAANITQPGRAYLQVGNNEIYELFQSAWSGAHYTKEQTAETKEDDRVYVVNEIGQGELINKDLSGSKESNQIKATQLDVVVEHIAYVFEQETTVEVKKPWLPSLSTMLISPHTQEVYDSSSFTELDTTLGLGLIDVPEEQDQREYMLDFATKGHILYMASSGYGKSIFLSNIILGLSMKNAVRNLNIYILDLGNSALIPYRGLPHVADYMESDDTEKIDKFQKLILDMLSERKKLFAQAMTQNFKVYNQSQEQKLKAVIIVVDNYDVVPETGESMVTFLQKVARDGASLGIYLAITMTRENVMRGATKGNFKERVAGFNFVEGENNSFIGRSPIQLSDNKRGRALVKQEQVNEMQLYTPAPCENEVEFNEDIKGLISRVVQSSTENKATGIPTLPESLTLNMLSQYPDYYSSEDKMPVGIDMDSLGVKYLEIGQEPALIIGNPGMGRTNMIRNALSYYQKSTIYLFDSNKEELKGYGSWENVFYANDQDSASLLIAAINEEVGRREENYKERTNAEMSLKDFMSNYPKQYILIDLIQDSLDNISDDGCAIILNALNYGIRLVVSSDAKLRARGNKLLERLIECRRGLIVGNIKEQSVFSYSGIREENRKCGIGYWHNNGDNVKVMIIESKGEE